MCKLFECDIWQVGIELDYEHMYFDSWGGMDNSSHHGAHGDHHGAHGDHHSSENMITTSTEATLSNVHSQGHELHSVGDASGSHLHHGMSMTFHGGYDETVLFEWWKFNSIGGLIASIFGIFIVAMLYEGLKYYREHLFWQTSNSLQYRAVQPPEEKSSPSDEPAVVQPSMWSKFHLWQTFLHGIQVSVSYLLMLIFMTYNSWLCLAVVAGAAFGNFLFGWKKSVVVDVTEHCH